MSFNQLIVSIEELNICHEQLIKLGETKKQTIIQNKVNEMIAITNAESKLVKRIEELELDRQEAVYGVLQQRGIKSRLNLTMPELIRLIFDQTDKQRLETALGQLSDTLTTLKQLNEINQQLLKQSLSYIDFYVETLSYRPETEVTYQNPADKQHNAQSSGLFDTRA
ncbi:flagellar biosynthesis protein FlgN [Paenibacillus sp. FSL H7-0326]|uniref:flagellar protein FlgN n=1 Tax=Paenibacillus sp. FSL H7-0326 TaxID=1921144 RepID=UPI00096ED1B4|nr:flagellar protein FlgN [Paenibacillus sp. FSL H7-0326]OMC66515.1 flagellar biosynthesis protein FlgN [Paenibacillus sp. FSL H7-0326]